MAPAPDRHGQVGPAARPAAEPGPAASATVAQLAADRRADPHRGAVPAPLPTSGQVEQLSYSQLRSDIAAGQVASVAIGPDGSISGKLTNGTRFESSYPTNLQDPQFTRLLDQHNVQVTTQAGRTSIRALRATGTI
ncbi:MAG TPA: ATP-dependent metallopeptidase FtsH/Yme1/Tma family protein [Actinomycetes bacterium]|nr:ATP-dependent metallopeptidase FtsH/Yme1/Tma family protein [Actinomycetes bacterium]